MVSSTALCMAMDLKWLDDVAFRPLPNIIALTMAAVHFVITCVTCPIYSLAWRRQNPCSA